MAQRTGTESLAPVLFDLGTVKGKTVRQFKEGRGPLVGELQRVVAEARQSLGTDTAAKDLVIVVVYRKKRKRKGGGGGGGLFGF